MIGRRANIGPFSLDNVVCVTLAQVWDNRSTYAVKMALKRRRATCQANGKPLGYHLRVKGAGHPASRAVMTPHG